MQNLNSEILFQIIQEKWILNANKLSETLIQMLKSKTLKMYEIKTLENTSLENLF